MFNARTSFNVRYLKSAVSERFERRAAWTKKYRAEGRMVEGCIFVSEFVHLEGRDEKNML